MALPSIVNPNESLARFINHKKGYFSTDNNSVRAMTFMPAPDLRLSVFRIDGLILEEVWTIAQREVIDVSPEPKTLYGMADIKASKVQKIHLEVEPNDDPPRHANIIGWPGPEEKGRQKLMAEELAAEAKLILK